QRNIAIQFNFVGDVEKIINPALYPYCIFHGSIYDEDTMNSIYQKADVLILTSAFEGLPVVVMQMMAHGKVVVSTAVNSIPQYIVHNENGLLINAASEEAIINEGVSHLINLYDHPDLRMAFGKRSKEIAIEKFSMQVFCKEYKQLLTC
ncbi:MAG: glycosyltransferase family 4 protein, partial [Sediminibacterium sp.]